MVNVYSSFKFQCELLSFLWTLMRLYKVIENWLCSNYYDSLVNNSLKYSLQNYYKPIDFQKKVKTI